MLAPAISLGAHLCGASALLACTRDKYAGNECLSHRVDLNMCELNCPYGLAHARSTTHWNDSGRYALRWTLVKLASGILVLIGSAALSIMESARR